MIDGFQLSLVESAIYTLCKTLLDDENPEEVRVECAVSLRDLCSIIGNRGGLRREILKILWASLSYISISENSSSIQNIAQESLRELNQGLDPSVIREFIRLVSEIQQTLEENRIEFTNTEGARETVKQVAERDPSRWGRLGQALKGTAPATLGILNPWLGVIATFFMLMAGDGGLNDPDPDQ